MRQKLELDLLVGLSTTKQEPALATFRTIAESFGHQVVVLEGDLQQHYGRAPDAIIAPGNSFGHMTGGLDQAIHEFVGYWADGAVRAVIQERFCNELNVGQAVLVSNAVGQVQHVVYAPTMRAPKKLEWGNDIPYRGTLAALQVIHEYNTQNPDAPIIRVMMPLMGAGTGEIPASVAILQQALAVMRYSYEEPVAHLFEDGDTNDRRVSNTWHMRF